MTAIAIIPARGGSRRIPRKNIREFHGKPIIAYSIEAAFASGLFGQHAYVSTDDGEIADVARQYGAGVLGRSFGMSEDEVGTQAVMADALRSVRGAGDPQWGAGDYACCIYPCAPMVDARELKTGFDLLALHRAAYVYPAPMRGDADPGQWYWGHTTAFMEGVPLGHSTQRLRLPDEFCIDINTDADWKYAESVYAALHKVPA